MFLCGVLGARVGQSWVRGGMDARDRPVSLDFFRPLFLFWGYASSLFACVYL